jgi:hypothetical protein
MSSIEQLCRDYIIRESSGSLVAAQYWWVLVFGEDKAFFNLLAIINTTASHKTSDYYSLELLPDFPLN